jgi:hypothetical protein
MWQQKTDFLQNHCWTAWHTSTVVGLRDRALISVMTFAFARIGAVVVMRVADYYRRPLT